ncbi:hypothetical protein IG631_00745 [Alternaria alternata]|nr:hypothetical protein IG631_00745 [Alternaria alternata]
MSDKSEVHVETHNEVYNYSMEVEEKEKIERSLNAGGRGWDANEKVVLHDTCAIDGQCMSISEQQRYSVKILP